MLRFLCANDLAMIGFVHEPCLAFLATPQAWRQGQTGYPLVDAAMKQLWSTGWAHNR